MIKASHVLEFIESQSRPVSSKVIAEALGMRLPMVQYRLKQLREAGKIVKIGSEYEKK